MHGDLEAILAHYGLGMVTEIRPISGGTSNENFLVKTLKEVLVLRRRSSRYSREDWAAYEQAYLCHVAAKGIPVPVPRKTTGGDGWVKKDGRLYEVFPWLGGNPFDRTSTEDVVGVGWFLGRLHTAAMDFNPTREKILPRYDNPEDALSALSEFNIASWDVSSENGLDVGGNLDIRSGLAYLKEQARKVLRQLSSDLYSSLPGLVIHGDYHPGNVRFMGGDVSALFDFDWVSRQPRVRDLADGILYFAAERDSDIDGGNIYSLTQSCRINRERTLAFLAAYRDAVGLPLEGCEIGAIPDFMRARWIYSRVQATAKVPNRERFKVLLTGVRAPLEWLDGNETGFVSEVFGLFRGQ